jgi:ectoine hydroxylase-related dioxygenase (phytanoyl-CoA dioxygenase family)
MNNDWAFLPMRASNDLLGDPAALKARLDEDSYLYFEQVIDPAKLLRLREKILTALAEQGWVRGEAEWLIKGVASGKPVHEGLEEYSLGYDAVQKIEEFHALAHDEDLLAVLRQVVGDTAFPHPLKIARLSFPAHYEVSTPPHQDFPNNQGTPDLTASWIPVGDCPRDLGGLAILRGSHHYGVLPLEFHGGAGNRQASLPVEMLEELRWVTTDYRMGDVLLFPSMTVHASLNNASEFFMRISVDFRYQQEGEALTEGCLEPHFQRLSWEEIYEGWESDRYQYYWKDLDYEVVPFEDLTPKDWDIQPDTGLQSAIIEKLHEGSLQLTEQEWKEILMIQAKRDARLMRRVQLSAAILGDGFLMEDQPPT